MFGANAISWSCSICDCSDHATVSYFSASASTGNVAARPSALTSVVCPNDTPLSCDTRITTLVFAWLMRHPSRPRPIFGSRRTDAAREAMAALDLRLTPEQWYRVWTASAGREVP